MSGLFVGEAVLLPILNMDDVRTTSSPLGGAAAASGPGFVPKRGRGALLVKGLFVVGTLVVSLAMLEVGLRAVGRHRSSPLVGYWEPGGVSFRLKKNVTRTTYWPTTQFTVHTCDLGFRARQAGPRRLGGRPYYAILGSSEIFGDGLDYEQTIAGVLAERLERHGIDVVNMAAPAQVLIEQSTTFKDFAESGRRPKPDIVLICLNPVVVAGYDDTHKDLTVEMGRLYAKDNWRIPLIKNWLESISADYSFFRDTFRNVQRKFFSRKDYDLSFYSEIYGRQQPVRTPAKTQDFLKHLKELEDYIRSLKARPVCVYTPTVGGFLLNKLKAEGKVDGRLFDTSFFPELIEAHCRAEGIQFINLEPFLKPRYDRGEKLNFDLDAHFNAPTSLVIGEFLYDSLKPGDRRNLP